MKGEFLNIDRELVENIDGGLTVSVEGKIPEKGYVYSVSKGLEKRISIEQFDEEDVEKFLNDNLDILNSSENYLGVCERGGNYYLDVVKVTDSETEAILDAEKNGQWGVYDLKEHKVIYTKLYEKNNRAD